MVYRRYMVLGVLVAAIQSVTGCHLLFRYEDNPVTVPDAALLPPLDGPETDTRRPRLDMPPPPADLGPPDLMSFYINEPFTSGAGVVKAGRCKWYIDKGFLRQDYDYFNGCFVKATLAVADYTAETYVQIHKIKQDKDFAEGAGLGVRVNTQSGSSYWMPDMYLCAVSPDANALIVARCPSLLSSGCMSVKKIPVSIDTGVPYRIRATVKGDSLKCELPGLGKATSYSVGDLKRGGVALITFFARASFDYLFVHPPQ